MRTSGKKERERVQKSKFKVQKSKKKIEGRMSEVESDPPLERIFLSYHFAL